jgi:hypothetical protein
MRQVPPRHRTSRHSVGGRRTTMVPRWGFNSATTTPQTHQRREMQPGGHRRRPPRTDGCRYAPLPAAEGRRPQPEAAADVEPHRRPPGDTPPWKQTQGARAASIAPEPPPLRPAPQLSSGVDPAVWGSGPAAPQATDATRGVPAAARRRSGTRAAGSSREGP